MTRHTLQGRDWSTPTHPQSEARRQHVHGPLLPMEREQLPAPILPRIGLALTVAAVLAAWALETPPAQHRDHEIATKEK